MSNKQNIAKDKKVSASGSEGKLYEITVQGQLDQSWSKWFEGMTLTTVEESDGGVGYTMLSGQVVDQSALHGLLNKIRDLNIVLISVCCVDPGTNQTDEIVTWN